MAECQLVLRHHIWVEIITGEVNMAAIVGFNMATIWGIQ